MLAEDADPFSSLCAAGCARLRDELLAAHARALRRPVLVTWEEDAAQPRPEPRHELVRPTVCGSAIEQEVLDSEDIDGTTLPSNALIDVNFESDECLGTSRSWSPSPSRRLSRRTDISGGTLPQGFSHDGLQSMSSMHALHGDDRRLRRQASKDSKARSQRRPSGVSNGTSVLSAFSKPSSASTHSTPDSAKSPFSSSGVNDSFRRMFPDLRRCPCLSSMWRFMTDPESSQAAWAYKQVHNPIFLSSVVISFSQHMSDPILEPHTFDLVSIAIDSLFFLELILGFICCPDRGVFVRDPYNYIDLFAASPLLPRLALTTGVVVLDSQALTLYKDILSIVPTLRLLKLLRRFNQFHLVYAAFQDSMEALPVMIYTLFVQALIFSSLIYVVEPRWNIETLPEAFWLVIVTMMTVGYGDTTPQSTAGFILITVLIISSALYMAIPLGIIGNVFNRVWENRARLLLIRRTKQRMMEWGYRPEDVPMLFSLFCKRSSSDGENSLSFREFNKMFTEMQVGTNPSQIFELYQYIDDDKTGRVTSDAFLQVVFPNFHAHHLVSRSSTSHVLSSFSTSG